MKKENKKGFMKQWWLSGFKYWYIAILDFMLFYALFTWYTNVIYIYISILTFVSMTLNNIFFENVINDMKRKGYLKDEQIRNHDK